eukprot:TRINITY_DN467_c0_g1_i1.p1 TRINITY_DN467_c0_g1~~TRINITY_DN467_c0_g1_i1.p1  ORF type:complete len:122 (+),score=12.93 TRINITY_DN467_c0_g1_i1:23-388(+)
MKQSKQLYAFHRVASLTPASSRFSGIPLRGKKKKKEDGGPAAVKKVWHNGPGALDETYPELQLDKIKESDYPDWVWTDYVEVTASKEELEAVYPEGTSTMLHSARAQQMREKNQEQEFKFK